jgi:hypothetical protein
MSFINLFTSQVLALGLALDIKVVSKGQGPVSHSVIPIEVTVCPEFLFFITSSKKFSKIGSSSSVMVNQKVLATNTIMKCRTSAAPRVNNPLDAIVLRGDVLS